MTTTTKKKETKHFGYMNSWKKTPQEILECHHKEVVTETAKSVRRHACPICCFDYYIDSSD